MANKRIIVKRRKSVRNIRKITRTMQLIATARFQAALSRATATKPYTEKLAELVEDLSAGAGEIEHRLMKTNDESKRSVLVVISSNRGLCGGYNGNVLRKAIDHLDKQKEAGLTTDTTMVGKKGVSYFRFLKREMVDTITDLGDKPTFDQIEPLANQLMDRFEKGEIASAYITHMKYYSAGKQKPVVMQLLPLSKESSEDDQAAEGQKKGLQTQFEFSPEPQELLDDLLPATVRVRLFQCFTDAIVCEQIARMVAMKSATDAAGDPRQDESAPGPRPQGDELEQNEHHDCTTQGPRRIDS